MSSKNEVRKIVIEPAVGVCDGMISITFRDEDGSMTENRVLDNRYWAEVEQAVHDVISKYYDEDALYARAVRRGLEIASEMQ